MVLISSNLKQKKSTQDRLLFEGEDEGVSNNYYRDFISAKGTVRWFDFVFFSIFPIWIG